jgi:hypothetical protein
VVAVRRRWWISGVAGDVAGTCHDDVRAVTLSVMSSNQIAPVGLPSVTNRIVTLVREPLFQLPERNSQTPVCRDGSVSSPGMSAMSRYAAPALFVAQTYADIVYVVFGVTVIAALRVLVPAPV